MGVRGKRVWNRRCPPGHGKKLDTQQSSPAASSIEGTGRRALNVVHDTTDTVAQAIRSGYICIDEGRASATRHIGSSGARMRKSARLHRRRIAKPAATRFTSTSLRKWDRTDFAVVALAAGLAMLVDTFLVKTPKTGKLTEVLKRYNAMNADDPIGQWLWGIEKRQKVPYDTMVGANGRRIGGMYPKSHRFQTLGHDPALGFIFGVFDIMQGTATGFAYSHPAQHHCFFHDRVPGADPNVDLVAAILRHIGHLLSDVSTPMGLPAPFMTLLQGFNVGNFGEKDRTIAEIARYMYVEGYDLRHFLAAGTVPAIVEIVLRAYIMLRHYSEHGAVPKDLASTPKYRHMLKVAHGIVAFSNTAKVVCLRGDPLAINVAEWQALARYILPDAARVVTARGSLALSGIERRASKRWAHIWMRAQREHPVTPSSAAHPLAALVPFA